MVVECDLLNDVFPHVILAWPWLWAHGAFALGMGFGNVYQGALTTEGAGLVWVRCCWHSRLGRRGFIHQEVGNQIFALVIEADIGVHPGVGTPRFHRDIRRNSWGVLLSLLLGLNSLHLNQSMYPIVELIWIDEVDLGDFHKFNKFLFDGVMKELN